MNNAVIYARVASNQNAEQSIERQRQMCREFAEKNGYKVIAEFYDIGKSRPKCRRASLLKMLYEAKGRSFQYVIVAGIDRISRNIFDCYEYKEKLSKYGVKVLAVKENPHEPVIDTLMENFYKHLRSARKKGGAK